MSIQQLKGKQVLAHLKLKQLEQRQELLRQEDTKSRLESLETRYEILRTDFQLKLLQHEEIIYADLPDVFEELDPFNVGVNAGVVKAPKQEYSTPRAEQKIESHDAHLQLNPNAWEFKSLPV